jgi:CheY-like chemotaxis protein
MKTILVVDDEFGIAEALSSLLSDEGYRVFTAPNGKQGLANLAEASPDLLIIDFMMPVLDGAGMLNEIRANPTYARLPIVLMSGVAEAIVRLECQGYDAFLRKPFNAEVALKTVAQLLSPEAPKG